VSSKFILSMGAYHTDIVLLFIAAIYRKFYSDAIFRSEIVLGITLKQSSNLLVSMFHSFILSFEAANKNSE
jgi:hypothetical protein